jgi:hypothetical protein
MANAPVIKPCSGSTIVGTNEKYELAVKARTRIDEDPRDALCEGDRARDGGTGVDS